MMTLAHFRAAAVVGTTALLTACAGIDTQPVAARTAPLPAPGAANCTALMNWTAPGARIAEASWVAAGQVRAREGAREVGDPLPEHCLVRGRIDERVGVDGRPYYTGFELRLPTSWAGRLLYQGGGGNDGILNMAVGRNTGGSGNVDNALQRGYAAVTTDAGHQGSEPIFGLDPQARIEHAWRAHERTASTAKAVLGAYYSRTPDRSYFIGCSGGGRQGMMFSQRFPTYFDGVIAVAPAMRVAEGASISAAWTTQRFLAAAPTGADGQKVLSQALSDTDLDVVAAHVVEQCDALDGLKDGLVQDVAACRIDPAAMTCKGGAVAGCLKPQQVDALRAVMAGPRNGKGESLYFNWPWDPGVAGADWRNWTLGTSMTGTPNSRHHTLISGALGHEFATPADPGLTVLNFDFDRDPARLRAFASIYNTADDVDLAGFRARNGKLLMIHGVADPIFSSSESVDYIERLQSRHGAGAGAFARLFLVPGMNHCTGGPATDVFDGLSALERWVEQGVAPDRIEARGVREFPGVSRPLCPWPTVARYDGGDASSAASFSCR